MKAVTSAALGSTLVLLLINFASAKRADVDLKSDPETCSLDCDPGYHIVVKEGTFYHNGKRIDADARYPVKMLCDLEPTCSFQFTTQTYSYLNSEPPTGTQLTINYDCKRDNFQGNTIRIRDYTQTGGCPHDSFVQKHVAYFNDISIAPKRDTPEAQREREMIAMGVSAQVRRFRLSNPNQPIDPSLGTVYLIYDNSSGKNDFMPSRELDNKCQLKPNAKANVYKYNCVREASKWTCNFNGKGVDLAIHYKLTGHLG
ncbi:uncharacterized protein LOC26526257 [Drosophila erecta]|uniref:Uncharacterized protein n=1 Tax=Drosophila erecta TaxID=7220 RepID=A0A0Q5UGS4_DROER|nr:uncharacterized protein LOC26526257 [Drosophila erecta]KQS44019.1 uncharacterized protein Dere_GG26433 [Drosophila erecta]